MRRDGKLREPSNEVRLVFDLVRQNLRRGSITVGNCLSWI